jgi:chromosome segregation ATPase
MSLEDFLISADIDNLIRLVKEKKMIETQEASRILKIPITTITQWAKTLEEDGLIKIEYKLTKEYLVWVGLSSEQYQEKIKQVEQKKLETKQKIEKMWALVDSNLKELDELKINFQNLKTQIDEKIHFLSGDLKEAEILTKKIDTQMLQKKELLQSMQNEITRFFNEIVEIKTLIKENSAFDEKKSSEFLERIEKFQKNVETKLSYINNSINEINNKVNQIRNQDDNALATKVALLEKNLADLKDAKNETLKIARYLLVEVKKFNQDIERIEQELSEIKEKVKTSSNEKIKQEIEMLYSKLIRETKELIGPMKIEFNNIKESANEYATFIYEFKNILNRLEAIEDKYQKEAAEIVKIIDMIEETRNKYLKDLEEAKNSLGNNKLVYEQLLEKAKKIELILSNIDTLKKEGEGLARKLKGLQMETEIAQIALPNQMSKKELEEDQELPFELVKKIELTKKEKEEFERKRDQLKALIDELLSKKEK